MAYTKTEWKDLPDTTTPVTASNLNNIEDGVEDIDTRLTTAERNITSLLGGLEFQPLNNAIQKEDSGNVVYNVDSDLLTFYIFINTHIYYPSIYVLFYMSSGINKFSSFNIAGNDTMTFTADYTNNTITAVSSKQCRGMLYKVVQKTNS